ncbi:hypothetical protein CFP65_0042 [Kitasatospora sp. MMS16-BH015]|uniref:hypothetical protein n=1 Tax=Kitasatospora sp. MMS16-BH015 TaxID=2018025 RepID=UPI000CA34033|nr:hypothetical protein [Kitasatospora sp. MMS16-BH015]AUG75028.1 hypothetical protein CFP65_0042 [Kitasatospora sp. MMS16-BH015]
MRLKPRTLLTAAVLPALLAPVLAAPAALATPTALAAERPATRHCTVLVSPTRTLGESCTDGRSAAPAVRDGQTLLLEEYADVNYGGGVLYTFYGDAGGCDATGYHLVNYIDVALNVSSMWGYNNCTKATLTSPLDKVETVSLPASYLGKDFNDAVRELQVFRG